MKVILLADVYKHGVAGQIVEVADGFARNYLLPRGMAIKADKSALKRTSKLREQVEARRAAYENKLNELARMIDGVELIFGRRAASTGKLFGSVTTQEIADALMEKTGVDINRRRISQQSLREVGTHEVPVRLGSEISPVLKITIVNQDDLPAFLAARERGEDVSVKAPAKAAATPVEEMETEIIPEEAVKEAIEEAAAAVEEAGE
jgi:large subunit ribosomal protein L9